MDADHPHTGVNLPRRNTRLPDRLSPYAQAALDRACKAIREAPDGAQQKTMNREVFNIGQLVAAGRLPEGSAFNQLLAAAADMVSYDSRRPWCPPSSIG